MSLSKRNYEYFRKNRLGRFPASAELFFRHYHGDDHPEWKKEDVKFVEIEGGYEATFLFFAGAEKRRLVVTLDPERNYVTTRWQK